MAEDTTKVIRIVIDSSKAVDGGRQAQRALEQIEKQTGTMASAIESATKLLTRFGGIMAAKFSIDALLHAVDAFTSLNNALKLAGVEGEAAKVVQDRLFAAANRNGVEIGALSQLYSRASVAAGELGASQTQLLKFVDGVTAALRLQGGSSEAASGALLQLSQSLSSGIVRAEEFNSILEGAFPIAQAAARGLDGMNGSIGKLRAAVIDGKVTSQAFFAALLKGFVETEAQAASMSLTIGQSMTANANAWTRLIGTVDKATGVSELLSKQIAGSTQNLDNMTKSIERGSAEWKPLLDIIQTTKEEIEGISKAFDKVNEWGKSRSIGDWTEDKIIDPVKTALSELLFAGANFVGAFLALFTNLPQALGKLFSDGVNSAINAFSVGLAHINDFIADKAPWLGLSKGAVSITTLPTGQASAKDYFANVTNAGRSAEATLRAQLSGTVTDEYGNVIDFAAQREQGRIDARRQQAAQYYAGSRHRDTSGYDFPNTTGRPPPPAASKEAQSQAEHLQKLRDSLRVAAEAQEAMTAAAMRGDVAFQQQQAHTEALQKAIEFFGGKLDAANPKVQSLAAELEKFILRTKESAAAQNFVVATTELEKQNVVLEAQNRLMNEAPEIQAREIALIKAKQEAEKGGNAITAEMIEQRRAAIEQNETLKLQAEQMKQVNELWTEPLKQGFRDIQSAGADAYEKILETGNFTFQSLSEVFTKTLRRMVAEFLALATIRPVLSLAVDIIGPSGLGILGGNSVAQLGYGGASSGGGGGASGGGLSGLGVGGGGLSSIFNTGGAQGTGWLARQFSGIGNWLSSPVSGLFSSTPAGGFSNVGDLIGSGQTLASSSAGGGVLGGLSIGSALGGLGSIGMGAYGLFKGGGGTASTIGSIGQIAGGIMMMIPGLQPFGAALSMLSGIIPGLFGDGPKIPPQPPLAYSGGAFNSVGTGFSFEGGSVGSGSSLSSGVTKTAADLQKAFRAAGLSVVSGRLIGGGLGVGMDHTLNGQQWQDRPYTETELRLPGGGRESLSWNDAGRTPEQASEFLLAQVFKANVLRGGVAGAGAGLTAGLEKINPTTKADLENVIAMGTAYDALGKATDTAKQAIDKINASFDDLKSYATQAGLSLEPINEELKKQTKRSAQDFIDAMVDPLAVSLRALQDERESALESAKYIRDNYKDIYVDMDKIATYYTNKEAALRDQFYAGGVTSLQAAIDSLTYGALANASPALQLSGAKAAYEIGLGKAQSGDATAIANLSSLASDYAKAQQLWSGSGPAYEETRRRLLADLTDEQERIKGPATSTATTPVKTVDQTNSVTIAQLSQMLEAVLKDNAELKDELRQFTGQARRITVAGNR